MRKARTLDVYFQWNRLLCSVTVLRPCKNTQFGKHFTPQRTARQHTLHRVLNHALRRLLKQFLQRNRLQVADVSRVVMIQFVFQFIAGNPNFLGIDDNNIITCVYMRCVFGLVLATQAPGNFS